MNNNFVYILISTKKLPYINQSIMVYRQFRRPETVSATPLKYIFHSREETVEGSRSGKAQKQDDEPRWEVREKVSLEGGAKVIKRLKGANVRWKGVPAE